MDHQDVAALTEPLASSFVWFEDGSFVDGATLAKGAQRRRDRKQPLRTREWREEHTYLSPNSAIFVGEAIEHVPPFGERKTEVTLHGYNTVVWAFDGTRWAITHWQWARGGIENERARWNEAFEQGAVFNKAPNKLLADTLSTLKPRGTALDIAMGQGRNAVYMATQGLSTTGIDISDVGIRQAKEAAAQANVTLEALLVDADTWDFGVEKWDVVTMIYAGTDSKQIAKVKPALKHGGLFILEYFHADSEAAKFGAGGAKTGELAAQFADGFEILRDDVVEDTADWGKRTEKLVRFVARKK